MTTKTPIADTTCAIIFLAYTLYLVYLGFMATDSVWIAMGFLAVIWIVCNAINFYLIHAIIRHSIPNRQLKKQAH